MGKSRRKTLFCNERGASLVEMALVSVVLLLLAGGVIDFGAAYNDYIVITNAAREGARYGSRFPHYADGIRNATKNEATNSGVTLTDANISIDPPPPTVALGGDPIRVTVTYTYTTIMGSFIGIDTLALSSSTEMVVFGPGQVPP